MSAQNKAKILLGIGVFVATASVSALYLPFYADKNTFQGPSRGGSYGYSTPVTSDEAGERESSRTSLPKKNSNSMWKNMDMKIKENKAGSVDHGNLKEEQKDGDYVNSDILTSDLIDEMMGLYQIIEANKVLVFSMEQCVYCVDAKTHLTSQGHNPTVVTVNERQRMALYELTSSHSMPSVWLNGRYVGGCNDGPEPWMGIKKIIDSGKLANYLSK